MTCLLTLQSSTQSTQEKKEEVWKRTQDADSDDRREQSIGRDSAGLGRIIKTSQAHKDDTSVWTMSESVSGWCETTENYCCRFFRVEICPNSKVSRLGYSKQTVTQKLARQGENIHRAASHTGPRRNPSNQTSWTERRMWSMRRRS
jgi:hypothetical protein